MAGFNDIFNSLTGKGINSRDKNGETKLYRAVRSGSFREVRQLLRAGADANVVNAQGLTPLHQAAYWGETEIVQALLQHGAKADADNGEGWTPLHSAALSGGAKNRQAIIDLLTQHGAKDDAVDKNGWSPRDYLQLWEENAPAAEKLRRFLAAEMGKAHPPAPPPTRPPQRTDGKGRADPKGGKKPPAAAPHFPPFAA